ncbi:MAG: HAD-IA family hydrolase [Rhodospirillales bacterium]|nr:HAD-IA family hydrolase [Rhodospirillales bacterium]MBN8902873.1 HAD-IA family hydrolase [Rhodospirillales bacterium]
MGPTLLLDLDGTLVDTVPDLTAALNRVMEARGLAPFAEAETARMVGDGVATLIARAFAARGGVPDATAVADYASDPALFTPRASRPFPGVVAALAGLAEAGWRLAVCTNKPEAAARSLLQQLGLLGFMAAVGGGDSFPARKPDPTHLLATLRAAGGATDRALMAGDHANDVAAARGAGVPAIFAAWGYGPPEMAEGAAAVAHDATEMARLARELMGA